MSAVWVALIGFFQAIAQPVLTLIGNVGSAFATYRAGQVAADDAARKAQDDAQLKADAAREAARSKWERNPSGRYDDDGFERSD